VFDYASLPLAGGIRANKLVFASDGYFVLNVIINTEGRKNGVVRPKSGGAFKQGRKIRQIFRFARQCGRQIHLADHFLKYCIKHGFKDN
jgi:hypothetical protein